MTLSISLRHFALLPLVFELIIVAYFQEKVLKLRLRAPRDGGLFLILGTPGPDA